MMARTIFFLAGVILIGWTGFQYLVGIEVRRIVTVHALDKAEHLADMVEESPDVLRGFQPGRVDLENFGAVGDMARAIHVASIYFIDPDGQKVGRVDMADASTQSGVEDHDHGLAEEETHRGVDPSSGVARHDEHIYGEHVHDSDLAEQLARTPLPDANEIARLIANRTSHIVSIRELTAQDGETLNYVHVILPVTGPGGTRIGLVGFVMDVSHIHSAYADGAMTFATLFVLCGGVLFAVPAIGLRLQNRRVERSSRDVSYLSSHDALTGLLNRSAFVQAATRWLEEGRVGFVAYLDGDRFKMINDTHGHCIGDSFLKHVSVILRDACGPDALLARFGGDEFAVVLPPCTAADAEEIFQTIARAVGQETEINGVTLSGTISAGVAAPVESEPLDEILHRVDTALYCAKSNGRNQTIFYTEDMGQTARRRRTVEMRLREAVRDHDFEIHYQPLVDARNSDIIGYEALLRLKDEDGAPISPGEFIPLAEETGLIEEIGAWVLCEATAAIAALDDRTGISVNLSADQFRSGKLVDVVSDALAQSGLAPGRLELEITESVLLDQATQTKFQIDALKEMGISLAMDDFGTGFSSLSTLWKYGFDRIKIDRSFVQALEETPERSEQLIDAIVLLGTRMGMSVTAEGIETDKQRAVLANMGCNVLQGFLFGRPAPLQAPHDSTPRAQGA